MPMLLLGAPNIINIQKDQPYFAQYKYDDNPTDLKVSIKNTTGNKKQMPKASRFFISLA